MLPPPTVVGTVFAASRKRTYQEHRHDGGAVLASPTAQRVRDPPTHAADALLAGAFDTIIDRLFVESDAQLRTWLAAHAGWTDLRIEPRLLAGGARALGFDVLRPPPPTEVPVFWALQLHGHADRAVVLASPGLVIGTWRADTEAASVHVVQRRDGTGARLYHLTGRVVVYMHAAGAPSDAPAAIFMAPLEQSFSCVPARQPTLWPLNCGGGSGSSGGGGDSSSQASPLAALVQSPMLLNTDTNVLRRSGAPAAAPPSVGALSFAAAVAQWRARVEQLVFCRHLATGAVTCRCDGGDGAVCYFYRKPPVSLSTYVYVYTLDGTLLAMAVPTDAAGRAWIAHVLAPQPLAESTVLPSAAHEASLAGDAVATLHANWATLRGRADRFAGKSTMPYVNLTAVDDGDFVMT
jgi:hypothetical protein